MKLPGNPISPQAQVENIESKIVPPPEGEAIKIDNEPFEKYEGKAEALIDGQSANMVTEAEEKIENFANGMNISPGLLDSAKGEYGLENQLTEIQNEASHLNQAAKLEISEAMAEASISSVPGSEAGLSQKNESTEDMLNTGGKVFDFLDRTKFLDMRKSDEQFNKWLQQLSYEDYAAYAARLNGIVREIPSKDRKLDGDEVSVGTIGYNFYVPPGAEQREGLMQDSFQALKQIPDNEDRALLAYYTTQAIHPYADGNGRTGRLLHEIISEEGKELTRDKLSELLDHEKKGSNTVGKGQDIFSEKVLEASDAYGYVTREVAKEVFGEEFLEKYGTINVNAPSSINFLPATLKEKLSSEEAISIEKILGEAGLKDFSFRGIVLAKFLEGKNDRQNYQYEYPIDEGDGVPENMRKKSFSIDGDGLAQNLTEGDVRQLIEIHKDIKGKFIKDMIDIFLNPQDHQTTTKEGIDVPIKNIFRKKGSSSRSV